MNGGMLDIEAWFGYEFDARGWIMGVDDSGWGVGVEVLWVGIEVEGNRIY
jgi:hypothetical protein